MKMRLWEDCSKAQKIERWENCLRVLKALTPHERRRHWNMSIWGEKTECGTVACAAGHCGLDPWFRRRGFKQDFVLEPSDELSPNGAWTSVWSGRGGDVPTEEFFGYRGADLIFHNPRQRPVSEVIREMKAHIKLLKGMDAKDINWLTSSEGNYYNYNISDR